MWNFLFLGFSFFTLISQRQSRKGGRRRWRRAVCVQMASFFQILGPVLCTPPITPLSHPPPPQPRRPHPDSARHAFVVPFSILQKKKKRWRSKSVHSLLFFCNGLETAKCRGPLISAGHINQGCHTACLPSLPPSHPLPPPSCLPPSLSL